MRFFLKGPTCTTITTSSSTTRSKVSLSRIASKKSLFLSTTLHSSSLLLVPESSILSCAFTLERKRGKRKKAGKKERKREKRRQEKKEKRREEKRREEKRREEKRRRTSALSFLSFWPLLLQICLSLSCLSLFTPLSLAVATSFLTIHCGASSKQPVRVQVLSRAVSPISGARSVQIAISCQRSVLLPRRQWRGPLLLLRKR